MLFIEYPPTGKSLLTVLNSSWLDRDRRKKLSLLELWAPQVIDALSSVEFLHEHGFVSGSLCPRNILYHPSDVPWGKHHVPGLKEDDDTPRDLNFAKWPYYIEGDTSISEEDDIIAAAVIVVECLLADENSRDSWKDYVKLEDKYDYQPAKLILDLVRPWKRDECPYAPLALILERIALGEVDTMNVLVEALRETARPFIDCIHEHEWESLACHSCHRELQICNLDFMAGCRYTR